MDKKIKLLAATSLVAIFVSGCTTAPAPWANQNRPHTGGGAGGASAQGGVPHTHNGVRHTHPLPAQGVHHTHQYGQGAGAVGQPLGGSGSTNTNTNNNSGGGSQTYGYDYGGYGGASSYDNTYGGGSGSGGYYNDMNTGYSGNYDGGSSPSGSNYDTSPYSGGGSSSLDMEDRRDPNYRDGDTYYTVQKTNTVFAVMRITGAYWKDIVKWNDLQAPKYVIVPGQRLRVK
jgi:hypothetical protein